MRSGATLNHSFRDMSLYMSKRAPILIIRKGIEVLFGVVTFAILARTLTKEQFAIYSLVFGFVAIIRLTALPGLGTAVSQAFARGLTGGFGDAVKLSLLGSLIGSIILLGSAWWHFYAEDVTTGQTLFVAAIFFPFVAGLTFWRNATMGLECYRRLLWYDGFSSVFKCCAVIFSTYLFPGLLFPVVIAAFIAPAVINVVATMDQFRNKAKESDREPHSIEYGIRTTIYQLPAVLIQQLDKFVLFYFISPEALAVYAVALRIPELARAMVGEINATLGPVFARERIYTSSMHRFSLKLWLLYGVASAAVALVVVPYLLPMLAGNNYIKAVPYAQFMTLGAASGYLGNIQFRYIKSHLHSRSFIAVSMINAVISSILILSLAYYYDFAGVVAAYVLKNLVNTGITTTIIKFKYLKG